MVKEFLTSVLGEIRDCSTLGFEEGKIYLRREGEPMFVRRYIGGGGLCREVFSLCIRTGGSGALLDEARDALLAAPLPPGAASFDIIKSPHLTNNSAATARFEMKCELRYILPEGGFKTA